MAKKDYDVGFKKPPKKTQFQAGQSGNPKGRPKGAKNLATELSEELSEKLTITEGGQPKKVTKLRAIVKTLVAQSLKGNTKAASTILGLIPQAEQAQAARSIAATLSPLDEEIIATFIKNLNSTQQTTGDTQ